MKFQRPSFLYPLFSEITLIPGIGPKTFKLLENKIGKNVIDLLFHLPHTVINRLDNLDLALSNKFNNYKKNINY